MFCSLSIYIYIYLMVSWILPYILLYIKPSGLYPGKMKINFTLFPSCFQLCIQFNSLFLAKGEIANNSYNSSIKYINSFFEIFFYVCLQPQKRESASHHVHHLESGLHRGYPEIIFIFLVWAGKDSSRQLKKSRLQQNNKVLTTLFV